MDEDDVSVWVVIVVAIALFLLSAVIHTSTAKGDTVCETVCWVDGWGRRVCETRCRDNDLAAEEEE